MRRKNPGIIRRATLFVLAFVLVAGYPFIAMADTQEPTTTPTTEVQPTTTQAPATETQTTQEAPQELEKKPPKPPGNYTYDPITQRWSSDVYRYNPATDTYEKVVAPTVIEPEITDKSSTEIDKEVDTDITLENDIKSDATSGDALVFKNTTAGGATTGDAAVTANVLNVVNSTIATGENQKVAQFTQDILGDVKGDIILSPLLLKAFLEAQAPENLKSTLDVNNNFGINNDLTLNANSGDATVMGNTNAGSATTGSATAVANVVNVLNSMIATQQSFIGTINIYGNLEGDILIAPDFIPQMIASNGGDDSELKVSSNDTQSIVNNISAVAESGAASVFGNGEAGSATTGDALSNVVIFNLSGHEVIAKNSLLVFVNVLGKWVGVIVDAPEGATAAMIGNGVTESNYSPDLTVNSQSQYGITNTIAVNAQSGDATVAKNTTAGNAVSGTAKAMANVANVTGSQFSASDWFGVLFINVFQSWHGSFGVDTLYGNVPITETPIQQAPVEFRPAPEATVHTQSTLRVIDSRSYSTVAAAVVETTESLGEPEAPAEDMAEFSASTLGASDTSLPVSQDDYRLLIIAGSILVIGGAVIGLKRLFN